MKYERERRSARRVRKKEEEEGKRKISLQV
jgi:hypothetical protein